MVIYSKINKTHSVVLTDSGFTPAVLRIRKGDSIKFSTNLDRSFWPASDPHPTHSGFSAFDPMGNIKPNESWTFKFQQSGTWSYHNHVDPSSRGQITVLEVNPAMYFYGKINNFYKLNFVKHDDNFIRLETALCTKVQENRKNYLECWLNLFSDITNDFGVTEAMSVLSKVQKTGFVTLGDCHLFADQIGTDAYWKYVAGEKFDFTKDFLLCDSGFFHHFMSEHVSHGQDLTGSEHLCDSLSKVGSELVTECYFGMGNGLAYYHWNIFNDNPVKIVKESLKKCDELTTYKKECSFGVYSGIDHLFEGQHGSELVININNPFELCSLETNMEYKNSCYERMIPSLLYVLGKDAVDSLVVLNYWINTIPNKTAKTLAIRRLGIMISEGESVKQLPVLENALTACRNEPFSFRKDCVWGVFYNVFLNAKDPSSKFATLRCDNMKFVLNNERLICEDAQSSSGI